MHCATLLLLLVVSVFLVLMLHAEPVESLYPYAIRGFVTDVRHQPLRFIGGLFFKKAFLLKKLKLKWKLKKKFVLKKLLKKLFISWKLGLSLKAKAILPQIFAQYWGYKEPYYWGWGGWSQVPHYSHHHHPHHHPFVKLQQGLFLGRKRRAIRFPEENERSISSSGGASFSSSTSSGFHGSGSSSLHQQHHSQQQHTGRSFFDDEFQSIGLGESELDMLRQLPENLQFEYKQEMQDLETSASEPREADIMEYLSVTNEFDTDHCIAKGICEVMARAGNRTSNQFENLLLDYYNEEPETRKDPKGAAAYVYDYAAFLGKSSRDGRACAGYFPKCPEPTQSVSTFMNEIFSSEMCDPPVTNLL